MKVVLKEPQVIFRFSVPGVFPQNQAAFIGDLEGEGQPATFVTMFLIAEDIEADKVWLRREGPTGIHEFEMSRSALLSA